ncbi:MAG: phosphoenolpyruvate synthase, partial [Verrucomicrobiales bacterium]|nr:phosphoenolpyruvate synthase [Verrucomicrobiales bacterium]
TGFNRAAINTVNGSGLAAGQHGIVPEGNMWLNNGTIAAPNDALPADITYDLGSNVNLSSLHIWNYNEGPSLVSRGARLVEILTASAPGGPFTSQGTFTLLKASGVATEPGQNLDLNVADVRLVKLNITANHGGSSQLAGLSEVKFYKVATSGTPDPVPFRETIASFRNSGTGPDGTPLQPGSEDPNYLNQTNAAPVLAMTPNGAWLADDGVSRFIGGNVSGNENTAAGTLTYRTTADFTGYLASSASVKLYVAADNSLDSFLKNGTAVAGVSGAGFSTYLGPFTISGPFNPGSNTFDFVWTNAGPGDNPGGIRIKWETSAERDPVRTELAANPVTSYFRRSFTLTGSPGSSWSGVLAHAVDDGAVFHLNGTVIHRVNVPAATTHLTPADQAVQFPMFAPLLSIPSGLLHAGTNVLAVELHQAPGGTSDALFGCSLTVTETPATIASGSLRLDKITSAGAAVFGIDLKNESGGVLNLASYSVLSSTGAVHALTGNLAEGAWLTLTESILGFRPADGDKLFLMGPSGAVLDGMSVKTRDQARTAAGAWMSPSSYQAGAQAVFTVPDSIVINEIMYQHAPTALPTGTVDDPEEWVELHNRSNAAVSLTGWKMRGGADFDFTAQTIPANGYLVVAASPSALLVKYPAITTAGPFSGSLSNKGGTVRLEDPAGNTADEVHYETSGRWDQRADGRGSSLELIDADADNSVPESWAASDETAKSAWQNFTWTGTGAAYAGTNNPTQYNEFILGLLNDGECLIDDISVKEVSSGNRELIQNGTFSSGNAATWRLLGNHGTHGRSLVVDDPSSPGNKVLKITATGATEHMHNHVETTLKATTGFVTLNAASTYTMSFRARWISGTPRLNGRLYFNRAAKTVLLPLPANTGTPGAPNSRAVANAGPSLTHLIHAPAVPSAGSSVTVNVHAADPDGMGQIQLKWRIDGAPLWSSLTMSGGPEYSAILPAQAGGTLVEFYVEAQDSAGAVSRYPAHSALTKWSDGTAPPGPGHGFRILMTTADTNLMHLPTNVMSNDSLPATVIYRESEVFYDARCRLKSSERGRLADIRLGFAVDFDPMQPFRGKNLTINLDRSSYGRGTTGSGYGQSDIWNWQFFNRAGGIPSMYNDLVYLISPRAAHVGSAQLTMAEFNDPYLDAQWNNGADTPTFKYELIYYPTTTTGGVEGLKVPQPDDVREVSIGQIGTGTGITYPPATTPDKEPYRWNFLIGNDRGDDDFSSVINLNTVFRQTGATYLANLPKVIDVDQWLRCFAALSLAGIGDHYSTAGGGWHNLKMYQRADGRMLMLPWDHDFNSEPADAALVRAPDLSKMIAASPAWHRAYYGHLLDIIDQSFHRDYADTWATHYQTYTTTGGD